MELPRKQIDILELQKRHKKRYITVVWKAFAANRAAMVGLIVVVLLFIAALGAEWIIPYTKAIEQNLRQRFLPPGPEHLMGTDYLGRDVFARILHGAKISLTMGFIPTAASLLLGMIFGGMAIYIGGRVDTLIMRLCDMISSIPGVLLALAMVAALGPGYVNVMIAVTIASVPDMIRYVRSVIIGIISLEYVEAARACGSSGTDIVMRHVLPNAMGPLILSAVTNISGMIMIGAGLSYLGLGIQPPQPEWGCMLAEGQNYFMRAPHLMLIPGAIILLAVLAFNLMGDGLRDALDPKLR